MLRVENTREKIFVDFRVYSKYMKINRPKIEVAEYAMIEDGSIHVESSLNQRSRHKKIELDEKGLSGIAATSGSPI